MSGSSGMYVLGVSYLRNPTYGDPPGATLLLPHAQDASALTTHRLRLVGGPERLRDDDPWQPVDGACHVVAPGTARHPGRDEVGATPMYVVLERNSSHTIGIGQDSTGQKVSVKRHMSGWVLANVLFLYGLPILYDLGTGGAYNFNVDRVHATLHNGETLASASWLAPNARIRFASGGGFEEARAEWARGDSIAWRWPVGSQYGAADTSDLHVAKLSSVGLQVHVGKDRPGGGRTGVRVMGALSTLGPAVGGLAAGGAIDAAVGATLGVYFFPLTLPLGYALGQRTDTSAGRRLPRIGRGSTSRREIWCDSATSACIARSPDVCAICAATRWCSR